tara:strand:+ start:16 stop:549 length:534 start_codon:yes stop_codon:yes gene_type:complete
MDSFELNKIIAAILMVVVLVIGIGKIADSVFHVKKPKNPGYKVELNVENLSASQTSSENQIDISTLMALGDLDQGAKIFKKCKSCHSIVQGGGNKIGPNLWGLLFRPVGAITDYKYSKALSTYGKEWTWEELNGFLIKPAKWIPANKMGFNGLKSDKDRASVMLYLNQNSDKPISLP